MGVAKTGQESRPKPEHRVRTILFVEQSHRGLLAKTLKETEQRMSNLMGFRIKIVERGGTSLKLLLHKSNPWKGSACGRLDCITCNQGGETLPDCTRRNVLYENVCQDCNPGEEKRAKKVEDLEDKGDVPSIYVGETSRSVKERALEHWSDFRSGDTDSHILKHWTLHHGAVGQPNFKMKVVASFKDALSRQVAEAIRIMLRKNTLNSKSGFNRCSIVRLVLEEGAKNDDKMAETDRGTIVELDKEGLDRLEAKRKEKDRASRHGKPAFRKAHKRKEGEPDIFVSEKRSKKRKYERIDIDWGLVARPAGESLEEETVGKFLREPPSKTQGNLKQSTIKVWTELELWVRRAVLWEMVAGVVDMVEEVKEIVDMVVIAVTEEKTAKEAVEAAETESNSQATVSNMTDRETTNVRGPILLPGSKRLSKNKITSFFKPAALMANDIEQRRLLVEEEAMPLQRSPGWTG